MHLGSASVKAVLRMLMKLSTGVVSAAGVAADHVDNDAKPSLNKIRICWIQKETSRSL
jgi:hypothetical protein